MTHTDQSDVAEQLPVKPEDDFWYTDTVYTHQDGRAVIRRTYHASRSCPRETGFLGAGIVSETVQTPQGPGIRQTRFNFDIPAHSVEQAFGLFHQYLGPAGKVEAKRLKMKATEPKILVPQNLANSLNPKPS